ncbi:hypothetical protein SOM26_00360 [Sphingomonas sp. CFBP8993]|uniref:hypothetical protein n=1 Tax=Sphingomonas sp. CFBP8993 TaxID=3096526 RepID=UPI002A69F2AA|nr:hypothetical protein [Sphingomonas sp. CFBP8993]MDY0957132.1 hypothetical protein [Sphingomonas sp. CFBP8993]
MKSLLLSLAGLTLLAPSVVEARPVEPAKATARKVASKPKVKPKPKPAPVVAADPVLTPSPVAQRVIDWVSGSQDNRGLPWAVVDKVNATLFLFAANGTQQAAVPVLIGIMPGDEASPGVGTKTLASLGPAEKTTPAGRYLAKFGLPVAGQRVLWVDYATSVALHPIPKDAGAREKRRERMLSPTPDDNRITFGCINIPQAFYARQLRPAFRKKGGYVYILPDTRPIEDVFPRLRAQVGG